MNARYTVVASKVGYFVQDKRTYKMVGAVGAEGLAKALAKKLNEAEERQNERTVSNFKVSA